MLATMSVLPSRRRSISARRLDRGPAARQIANCRAGPRSAGGPTATRDPRWTWGRGGAPARGGGPGPSRLPEQDLEQRGIDPIGRFVGDPVARALDHAEVEVALPPRQDAPAGLEIRTHERLTPAPDAGATPPQCPQHSQQGAGGREVSLLEPGLPHVPPPQV